MPSFYYTFLGEKIADLYANSYKESYLAKVDIVQQNRRRNEYFSDELDDVLEDIQ